MPAFARGGGDREADAGSCGEAWGEGKHPRTPVDKHGCVAGRPAFPQAQPVANTKELFVERLPDGPAAGPQAFSQPPYPPAPLTPGARGAWSSAGRCRRPGPGEGPAGQAHAPLPRARPRAEGAATPQFSLASVTWAPGPANPEAGNAAPARAAGAAGRESGGRRAGGAGAPPLAGQSLADSAGAALICRHRLLPPVLPAPSWVGPAPRVPRKQSAAAGARTPRSFRRQGPPGQPVRAPLLSQWAGPWSCWVEASAAWPPVTT